MDRVTGVGPGYRFCLKTCLIIAVALTLLGTTEVKEPVAAGIGLQAVPTQRGEVVVLAVLRGSPAEDAGLKPGDLILQVDGDPFLVTGTYGKGRTLAFASDCSPHWGPPEFTSWDHYPRFWHQAVQWLAGRIG